MPASATIDQILGGENLTMLIQQRATGIPFMLPPAFRNVTDRVEGKKAKVWRAEGIQEVAQIVNYGSPAKRITGPGLDETEVDCLHVSESKDYDPQLLRNLRNPATGQEEKWGKAEVVRQIDAQKQRLVNLRYAAITMAIAKGYIYFDTNGNLSLTTVSGGTTVDYTLAADHRNQLGGIIAADWATASTAIGEQIRDLKEKAAQDGSPPLELAYYGSDVSGFIWKNTNAKQWLSYHKESQQKFYDSGEIPDGLFGLRWVPLGTAFFRDAAGTVRQIMNTKTVCFSPAPSPNWWRFIEGSMAVPRGIGITAGSVTDLLNQVDDKFGMFAYAAGTHNPIKLEHFFGDTFLPYVANRNALFVAVVSGF